MIKLLLATRAIESPPYEGGFVLLSDIANEMIKNNNISPAMFSIKKEGSAGKIYHEKIFSNTGWGKLARVQFPLGLRQKSRKYNIVHTAHIPTLTNSKIMRLISNKYRGSGTKFIQTITGLPNVKVSQIEKLIWGDIIVCQSPKIFSLVKSSTNKPVKLVVPWPSPERIDFNKNRMLKTRENLNLGNKKLVVFPGEFERMGIGVDFKECLEKFFRLSPDATVILACRFDNLGVAKKLEKSFPNKVISVGQTKNIIELLEAADLVIFPTKKMDEKFHPPLVIMEALSLGTSTLISDKIDLDINVSKLLSKSLANISWNEFAKEMNKSISIVSPEKNKGSYKFQEMVNKYKDIYEKIT